MFACRGAKVIVANRNRQRAEQLVGAMNSSDASVVDWADLQAGKVKADVLANTTSIGMAPQVCDGWGWEIGMCWPTPYLSVWHPRYVALASFGMALRLYRYGTQVISLWNPRYHIYWYGTPGMWQLGRESGGRG